VFTRINKSPGATDWTSETIYQIEISLNRHTVNTHIQRPFISHGGRVASYSYYNPNLPGDSQNTYRIAKYLKIHENYKLQIQDKDLLLGKKEDLLFFKK
jgi:hypothetical protein